jgi:hypothetical protein
MHEDRKNKRKALGHPAWIAVPGEPLRQCYIEDASDGGAKLAVPDAEELPRHFKLLLSPRAQTFRDCEVRWKRIGSVGVRYLRGSSGGVTQSADMVS